MHYRVLIFFLLALTVVSSTAVFSAAPVPIGFDGHPLKFERALNYQVPLPKVQGFYVKRIYRVDAPAIQAGLREERIIHSIEDQVVEKLSEIRSIFERNAGDTVTMVIYQRSPEYERKLQQNPFYRSSERDRYITNEIQVHLETITRDPVRVYAIPESPLYHRSGFKHSPSPDKASIYEKREQAEDDGLSPCPICFVREESTLSKLLEMGGLESQKIAQKFKDNFKTSEMVPGGFESLVKPLSDQLLTSDPDPSFMVVHTDRFFAYGLQNGLVIVSDGILDVLETRPERAAFLAKMLAHYDRKQDHDQVETKRFRSLIERAIKRTTGVGLEFEDIKEWSPNIPGFRYYYDLIEEGYGETQEREAYFYALVYLQRSKFSTEGMNSWVTKRQDMIDQLHPKWIDYQLVHPIPPNIEKDLEAWNSEIKKF